MRNRRGFLKQSAAAAVAGMLLSKNANASFKQGTQHPVGLQLFTFFDTIDNDVQGTLKQIAAIGYKEIESAFSKKGGYLCNWLCVRRPLGQNDYWKFL